LHCKRRPIIIEASKDVWCAKISQLLINIDRDRLLNCESLELQSWIDWFYFQMLENRAGGKSECGTIMRT
jgi:hypothetical protein